MKTKFTFLAVLLFVTILLGSCTKSPELPHNTESQGTVNTPEIPTDAQADPFENLRDSREAWLTYGLSAYESDKEVDNLKEFFSDRANMTYLTLYDHMFAFDKKTSVEVAKALFSFIYNEYGADALLDSVLGTRNNLVVKVRYRLGSRNC